MGSIPEIYTGTAGWSYKDWQPNFYPYPESKKFSWLEYYSGFFNIAEVNSTYYAYLNPVVAEGWAEKTSGSPDFLFSVKLHSDFTHKRDFSSKSTENVKAVLDILDSAGKLAGILVQFPYSFGFSQANAQYIARLRDIFTRYGFFLEVRHTSWNNNEIIKLCGDSDICLCSIDQPVIGRAIRFMPVSANGNAYIRFHGRNAEAWKKSIASFGEKQSYGEQSERYNYLYSPGELASIQGKIKELYDSAKKIYIIMNNHPNGNAVANAFEMIHYLEAKTSLTIPETVLRAFPRLKSIAL